jgi:cytidylate kinase
VKPLLVTVDGPAGAGKTTVSRLLAKRLGYTYVDTGALYRAVALAALSENCPADDDTRLAEVCSQLRLRFENTAKGLRLYMNEADITDRIRTEEIGMVASAVSARAVVRECLLSVQREMGENGGAVFEGRDMGTVVFPEADIKFFLDADPSVRAFRRYKELAAKGASTTCDEVTEAMVKRDEDDSKRALSPLKPASDAIRVDSSSLEIEQVVELMLQHVAAPVK